MYPYVVGTPQVQVASVKTTEVQAYQTRCAFVLYLNAINEQFGQYLITKHFQRKHSKCKKCLKNDIKTITFLTRPQLE